MRKVMSFVFKHTILIIKLKNENGKYYEKY